MTLGVMNSSTDREDLIQLEPLVHQVGGHSSMFVLDDMTVCKPLIGREHQFYRTLPNEMKRYTPEFRGSLQVVLQEDGNGISLAALPNEQTLSLQSTQGHIKRGSKLRRVSSSSIDYESSSSDEDSPVHKTTSGSCTHNTSASAVNYGTSLALSGEPRNPWLEERQQNHLQKLKQKSDSSNVVECIMLENLTFKYRHPCVLDLKMGTRQYGDDAPESKRRSQTAKAAKTTTATLGVRLVGMQVYNREKKSYTCRNKYFGRQLSEESFKQTLRLFLHNGKRIQLDITDCITSKLKELRSIIAKLDSFRFFTTSLLIIYDSSDSPPLRPISEREKDIVRDRGSDRDIVRDRGSDRDIVRDRGRCRDRDGDRENYLPSEIKTSKKPRDMKNRQKIRGSKVDIRLIDFAHATHNGMKDSTLYKGSDEGLLMGLDSLIKIFQDIRDICDKS